MVSRTDFREGLTTEQLLTRYKAWADDLTFAMAVRQPREELLKQRQTTFGTIAHTLHHTYIVDVMFQAHLEGREHGYKARTTDTPPEIEDLREAVAEMNQWWIGFSDEITDGRLAEPVEFAFVNGDRGVMTRREIIMHVVQHATYHRGYVDDMMYQIPVIPPATDLTVFLQLDAPI